MTKPLLFFLLIYFQLCSVCYSQVSISKKEITYQQLFKEITKQTGYKFIFNTDMISDKTRFDVDVKDAPLEKVLSWYLGQANLSYQVTDDKTVVIQRTDPRRLNRSQSDLLGKVVSSNGTPLEGATVSIKGTKIWTQTNKTGQFSLPIPSKNGLTIVVSFIGYIPQELGVWEGTKEIKLTQSANNLGEVQVSTGMFTRNKSTFTGAVATFSGKELRQIGNLNVIQSLKTLDPSFSIATNNAMGSNPNQMPKIELRGKSSLSTTAAVRDQFSSDPNQPLFILNGMETTLQQIVDLDMNRIASVTLLKDASSTALYGSRAANGVVVVETTRPKPGELNISLNSDFRFEAPDLSGYNMMNAAENLEFQRLSGLYTPGDLESPRIKENLYNNRLIAVKSGVDNYWLNVPLQNSFTQGYSLQANGGAKDLQYNIGLNYRTLNGVMKGSGRDTWGGNIFLSYRTGKLNITNDLYINGTISDESPYGTFQDYTRVNPYYAKKRADGSLNTDRYLEEISLNDYSLPQRVINPLYNANLEQRNHTDLISIRNNLNIIYDLSDSWRFSGAFQLTKDAAKGITFLPAEHTNFDGKDVNLKGLYTESRTDAPSYQVNLMMTYRKVLNEKHSLNGNLRAEMQEQGQTVSGYSATGFPAGVRPNPSFSFSYLPDAKPLYQNTLARRVNTLGSFNYAYDNRYFVDLNFRIDGSTAFGSAKKYSPFWSAGIGWNVHKDFARELEWLDLLRLRANIGTTGNQALGSYASTAIFGYNSLVNYFGQGIDLRQLGNPNLNWQKTRSLSLGLDLALWNNRLNATFNAYEKYSNPLVVTGSLPASSGVSSYPLNVGALRNRGIEGIVRYSPIYRPSEQIIWTLGITAALNRSHYEGFSDVLRNLNKEAQESKSFERYLDGYSPDEIWAVQSLGIDPATGSEVFRKKNGEVTFTYDPSDVIPAGNGRPVVEGIISTNLSYKGFLLGANLRYSFGTYLFNEALFNKVENISYSGLAYNQDKRAMDLRWKQIGDIAQFKAINNTTATPASTRFVQRENFLTGESFNVGYEFRKQNFKWLSRAGIRSLRLNAYTNDIFRLSNLIAERGTAYPYSKSFSFGMNVFFN
jgi:TonB-linked SusC/RagA family outer membrane protein